MKAKEVDEEFLGKTRLQDLSCGGVIWVKAVPVNIRRSDEISECHPPLTLSTLGPEGRGLTTTSWQ